MEHDESLALLRPNKGMHRLHIPAEVIFSLAVGADDPYNTLTAYGISEDMIPVILEDPAIQKAVQAKQTELRQSGYSFRLKAAMGAEMLLDSLLIDALGEKVPLAVRHDIFKSFAKLGNLEPREDKQAVAPTGFTVNIQIGNRTLSIGGEKPGVTVNMDPELVTKPVELVQNDLDNPPEFLRKQAVSMPKLTPIFDEND